MRRAAPRWALSFADLCLLLLAFFIFLYASDPADVSASARAAFPDAPAARPLLEQPAAPLFEPGEARLTSAARKRLIAIGAVAARGQKKVRIESRGRDSSASRFDSWELAAARAASAARALSEGGLDQSRIDIDMTSEAAPGGQRLTLRSIS